MLLAACQPIATVPKAAKGGTAVEALVGTPGALNPLFERDDTTRDVDAVIYQGLTTVDANQRVVGLLARDWSVSPDHMTYTFDLRTDVKWSDGEPFSVADVLFTFQVLQDQEYDQPDAGFWRQLGVKQGGANQVVFTLRSPSAAFPLALRIGIIAKHVFDGLAPQQIESYPNIKAVGTGPFKIASIDSRAITLDRNPFANPQPWLDHLVMRTYPANDPQAAILAVRSGLADLVGGLEPEELSTLQNASQTTIIDAQTYTSAFVTMNPDGAGKPYFSNVKVRQAIVQAIDRSAVINEVLSGRGDVDPTPIPAGDWAFTPSAAKKYPYDPEAANAALDQAGWTLTNGASVRSNKLAVPFQVDLVVTNTFPNQQIAQVIARQLSQVGVKVNVQAVSPPDLVSNHLLTHNYQMALVVFDVGPDPDLYSLWHSAPDPGTLNFSYGKGWGLIDKDLEDGRAEVEQPARLAAYADFQSLIADMAPAIFLYSAHYDYAVSQRVRGVHMNHVIEPEDRFQYVTDWYVNTGQ